MPWPTARLRSRSSSGIGTPLGQGRQARHWPQRLGPAAPPPLAQPPAALSRWLSAPGCWRLRASGPRSSPPERCGPGQIAGLGSPQAQGGDPLIQQEAVGQLQRLERGAVGQQLGRRGVEPAALVGRGDGQHPDARPPGRRGRWADGSGSNRCRCRLQKLKRPLARACSIRALLPWLEKPTWPTRPSPRAQASSSAPGPSQGPVPGAPAG